MKNSAATSNRKVTYMEISERCFKIDKNNAQAMIEGYNYNGKYTHQAIYCDVVQKPFPMLITLNRSKSPFRPSPIGKSQRADSFNMPYKYVAFLDSEYFIRNELELWKILCDNGLFNIWLPESPYKRFNQSKKNKKYYRILLLRIYEISEEINKDSIIFKSARIDNINKKDTTITIKKPIIDEKRFSDIKSLLKKSIRPFLNSQKSYTLPKYSKSQKDEIHFEDEKKISHTNTNGKNKIARICWNNKHWVCPSGREGKSLNENSYEFKSGFGFEEWNFDTEKVIDGYVYGFLQQFNNKTDLHVGKKYNIYMYSIQKVESNRNIKWWIGNVNSCEVISRGKSSQIHSIYKANGWLDQMESDLKKLNIDTKIFLETSPDIFLNIRFKTNDIDLLDSPIEIDPSDDTIKSYYYNLLPYKQSPSTISLEQELFSFKAGHNEGKISAIVKKVKDIERKDLLHNEYQTQIYNILEKQFGKGNVGSENQIGYQSKVDLVVNDDGEYIFYELKIAPTAKAAIREAFGQILEYSYWPDKRYATKLVIISPQPSTIQAKKYLKNIREKFQIPIYYQQYDVGNSLLKQAI